MVTAYVLSRPSGLRATQAQFEITRCRALITPEDREPRFRSEEHARNSEAYES
jgi:hypothetical protein